MPLPTFQDDHAPWFLLARMLSKVDELCA
jgi:hypothetical protein